MIDPAQQRSGYLVTFFLPDRHRLALARAGVGVGALAAHRQPATMAQPAIAAEVHQPLDVHRDFTPQVALDAVFAVDQLADPQHLVVRQLVHPALIGDGQPAADFGGLGRPDAIDVAQADGDALIGWNVHAGNTCHAACSCAR